MPQYKLTYFNVRGRAEVIRYVFAQAGVAYEDKRVTGEEWQKLKPNTPYGLLPVLEVDGKQLGETGVIARYLAEEFGLAGSNAFENADIASIMGVRDDLISKIAAAFYIEKDEARKADLKKALEEEHIPKCFSTLNKRASGNNCAAGWIYGAKVTYADLMIFALLDWILPLFPNALDKFPAIAKLKASVEQLPNIAKWLKERPQTEH